MKTGCSRVQVHLTPSALKSRFFQHNRFDSRRSSLSSVTAESSRLELDLPGDSADANDVGLRHLRSPGTGRGVST